MKAFKQDLACGLSRKEVYRFVVKHDIDRYYCDPSRIRPPKALIKFSCGAGESLAGISLEFDRSDKLQTIQSHYWPSFLKGVLAGFSNLRVEEEESLCD